MILKSAQKKKFRGFTLRRELINLKHGFTLIELLITIAIMGILAAAVLVAINPVKRQNQAKDSNVKSDIVNIATALQTYYTSKGYYPGKSAAMNDLVGNGELTTTITPPTGSYIFDALPALCTTAAGNCTSASVSYTLLDPQIAVDPVGTQNLWCFRTSQGKAIEVTNTTGCPAT